MVLCRDHLRGHDAADLLQFTHSITFLALDRSGRDNRNDSFTLGDSLV